MNCVSMLLQVASAIHAPIRHISDARWAMLAVCCGKRPFTVPSIAVHALQHALATHEQPMIILVRQCQLAKGPCPHLKVQRWGALEPPKGVMVGVDASSCAEVFHHFEHKGGPLPAFAGSEMGCWVPPAKSSWKGLTPASV